MYKILALTLTLGVFMLIASCGGGASNSNSSAQVDPNDNPTEAYKRLYTAVKAKDATAIKGAVSTKTHGLAEMLASKQKVAVDEVYKNGFTGTTFADTLPEIRDQRVKDNMGAVEVWNAKDKQWEDLPFIREESGWKLAVGDMMANSYRSPGKGRDAIEREAANVMAGNNIREVKPTNVNSGSVPPMPPVKK
jgi:hypothetical protein